MSRNDTRFDVRIGHFIPDAPAVDVLVDGYPVLTNRSFGEVNDYTNHEAAEYDVTIRRCDDGETLLENPVNFERGHHYTLLLVGTTGAPEFRLLVDG